MATVTILEEETTIGRIRPVAPPASAVSWPAIFAGATGSAALSLILLVLGMGLGFSIASPWAGPSSTAMTASTIIWICITAFAASGLGGYIAGRLRNRWPDAQRDEVYFRDTAHGFLSWAVTTLITAATLASVIGGIVGADEVSAAASGTAGTFGADARALGEEARSDAAKASLWIFVSLLIGAFSASLLATWGGRQRDLP